MSVVDTFTPAFARRMSTPNSLKRGQSYARNGRVILDLVSDQRIDARVKGTSLYRVYLSVEEGSQSWGCGCPASLGNQFCKHLVATAIVAADPNSTVGDPEEILIGSYLASLPVDELASIITAQAAKDERFATNLLSAAQLSVGEGPNLAEWKKKVTKAYGRGFVDYRHAPEWAARVNDILSAVADIGEAGHHQTAALLAEHAHKRTETAAQRVDDSDGWITNIFGDIRRVHTKACLAGAFPPKRLAQRLVKLELSAELDTFHRSAVSHADALGPDGLAEYRRLVDLAYAKTPTGGSRTGERFRVCQARIAHAIASNDPDRLIEVIGNDLISPNDYVEIVDAMERAGRIEDALEWANRGLENTADRSFQQPPLIDARARILRTLGHQDEIEDMYWERYAAHPTTSTFATLLANSTNSDEAQSRAIDHLLARLGEPAEPRIGRTGTKAWVGGPVGILLAADQEDTAWAVALRHGASWEEWSQMADLRAETNPDETIAIWALEVEGYIERKNKANYRRAVKVLTRIEKLASAVGRPDLYVEVLLGVQSRHKNKPSLMKLLN